MEAQKAAAAELEAARAAEQACVIPSHPIELDLTPLPLLDVSMPRRLVSRRKSESQPRRRPFARRRRK